jgi:DNA-binding transcriptional ArsR family regulator
MIVLSFNDERTVMTSNKKAPDLAAVAALMGDPARAAILDALMSGQSLTAGELSTKACVSPQTTSSHLNKLREGGLVTVESVGKRRFYEIANHDVAHAIEALCLIAPPKNVRSLKSSFEADALRRSRTCYDHLAGKLGVAVTESLVKQKIIKLNGDLYTVTQSGISWFESFGIDLDAARQLRRKFAYPCLDWSERRHHLAGSLGAALKDLWLHNGWIKRIPDTRAVRLTKTGEQALGDIFQTKLEV